MKITTTTQKETEHVAINFASELTGNETIALYGTLGMGKTVFARSLIRALTKEPELEVPSPTFTLVQTYDSPKGLLYHYDFYRLENPEEIYELGWEEAQENGIIILEWPERITSLLPPKRIDIHLSKIEDRPDHRTIEIIKT